MTEQDNSTAASTDPARAGRGRKTACRVYPVQSCYQWKPGSCECLSRRFYSPRKRGFCRAVRMNTISLGPSMGSGTSQTGYCQGLWCLRSCTVLFIGADNAALPLAAVRVKPSLRAITCSTEIFSFVFIAKPPGLCTEPHIHDSRSGNFDDVSRIYAGLWRGSVESRRSSIYLTTP